MKLGAVDFAPAELAGGRFASAAQRIRSIQTVPPADAARLNAALRQTETDFLSTAGLPNRPWYRHTIYAPGEYTGYAAVVIPGVNEAIDAKDSGRTRRAVGCTGPGAGPRGPHARLNKRAENRPRCAGSRVSHLGRGSSAGSNSLPGVSQYHSKHAIFQAGTVYISPENSLFVRVVT